MKATHPTVRQLRTVNKALHASAWRLTRLRKAYEKNGLTGTEQEKLSLLEKAVELVMGEAFDLLRFVENKKTPTAEAKTEEVWVVSDHAGKVAYIMKEYAQSELRTGFDLVCNPSDWKAPICAPVKGELVNLVVAAVRHFTATTPTVTMRETPAEGITFLIESPGYRLGPAGDH